MNNRWQSCLLGLGSVLSLAAPLAYASGAQDSCQNLQHIKLPGLTITQAQWEKAGPLPADPNSYLTGASGEHQVLPKHCLVRGELFPYKGVDNKRYATRFEVRLPVHWNHSFLFQGGGGMDGFLAPALGSIPAHQSTAKAALVRGFAVASMDGGHIGRDASFGFDQQARINYAYQSIGEVTTAAKTIIRTFYSHSLTHSIFMGCSNGGREAMVAAQRFPTQFDGVVIGDPGFHLSAASIGEAWDSQQLMSIAPKNKAGQKILANALTPSDLKLLSQSILNKCDALDGIKDGLINNFQQCHYNPAVLTCKNGQTSHCLAPAKVNVIKAIFKGVHNSQGKALYSSWPYDAGVSASGWRLWKLGTSQTAKPNALNITLGGDSLPHYFMTPPVKNYSSLDFNFDKDPARLAQTAAINDMTSTFLSTFFARGGKMIIFQGVSDPVFSADDIAAWYNSLVKDSSHGNLAKTQQSARLFMIPGMTHCGGGPALDNIDPLTSMQTWLNKGKAPAIIPAHGVDQLKGKSQPLCPYPAYARYIKGNPDKITSYQCVEPQL
ncbi:tannase/feruloyl esterase family alpha/beta hydrolase [Celerinatantimonas sp. MCCC 1A17872]|uniref:tannase/feruloyl esterase family alpha/beta hydrolase n=1 Tax=Celerinatantimonas sp. MCCC 1A17872 TaxID=3177514 RepID=UPI0038C8EA80